MNKRPSLALSNSPTWGAIQIAVAYLLVGGLWILFSDQVAARIALSERMLTIISLYKGWGYVLITGLLLYLLIQRHTAKLSASEAQLHRILDTMPALISYVDKERRYQFTNSAYQDWFEGQVLGKHVQEVIGVPAYKSVSQYIDRVLSGETVRYETEISLPDGERFIQGLFVPDIEADGKVKGYFALIHDLTEQKKTREEIQLWANAFEGCAHGIAIGDPNTNRITVCNPAFASLHKSRVEDIVGSAILSLYAPSDHERVRRNIEKADQIGHARFEAHMTRRGKDGSAFPVQMDIVSVLGEDGELLHRVATAQDISERKQAEEKLRKNEERYRYLFENNPHPMLTYDLKTLTFLDVNEAAIEKYGYSRQEFLCMTIADIRPPEDVERLREHLAQPRPALQHSDGWRHRLKDGTVIDVEITSHTIEIDGHEAVLVVAQDITERLQAEEKLKESEAKYRTLVEHLPAIIYISEPDKYVGVSYISPQIESYGFDADAWLADPKLWFKHIHPEDQERVTSELQLFQAGAEVFRTEYRLMLPNGEARWFHDESIRVKGQNGKTILKQGFMLDITESKRAEQALQTSQRLLQDIIDNSSSLIYLMDLEGRFLLINRSLESVLGRPREELIGKTRESVLPLEIAAKHRANDLKVIETRSPIIMEEENDELDGEHVYLTNKFPLLDQNGNLYGVGGISADITQRQHAEEALRTSQAQLSGIFNSAMDAIISTDADQRILIFNPAAEAMFQCKQSDAIGQTLDRFIPERFREIHRRQVDNFGQTGITKRAMKGSAVVFGRRSNGEEFPCEASISQVTVAGKKIFTVILRDVSERLQVEEGLRQSEERFASVFRSSPTPIALTRLADGKIMDVNEAFCQLFGYSHEEIVGHTSLEIGIDDPGSRQKAVRELKEKGMIRNLEQNVRDRNGRQLQILNSVETITVNGEPYALTTIIDITERKQAEEYLRRFELLSEHSRDIILFINREDVRILEANAAAVQVYGYSREELLSLTVRDLRASDTLNPIAEQMAQADTGGILFETIHRRKDGSTFPVEVSSQGATVGGVRTLISIIRDISERKQAEEALRQSEQRLKHAQEIAHLGSWELDLVNNRLNWSDEVYRIFGLQPQEFGATYEAFLEAVHPEDRAAVDTAYSGSIQAGQDSYEIEHRVVKRSSGEVRIVHEKCEHFRDQAGQIIRSIGMVHDITERKQIEKALQAAHDELELKVQERTAALSEANALMKALMDNMPDHIYFKDLQSRFIRTSKSQATLLGLSDPAEAIGKTDFDFFPHAARSFAEEQEVMSSGDPLIDLEEWVVWPDGRETWVSTTKLPLRDAAGQTIGIFGISHDITERKRTEQEIKQLNADLERQAEKLQAANKELEAFSYSVSHDLRAPLRAIDGYTRILVEDYESILDAEGKRICGIISREARRMGQLIDDLLAFSRLGRKEIYTSKIDMRGMAVSVLNELLKEEDRKRLEFQIGKLPAVRADSSLIRQVWFNLLANAIKFTSRKEQAVIEIGSKTTKEELIYYVRDSGAGFDMEYANKLFGVFQRLHSESEFDGTGVGLAIVQRIIHRHEGRVWAEGEVGKGATFFFALPRKEDHHE